MKILAVILARKGSKRIKNKNKIIFGKKRLIEYTFTLSEKISTFTHTLLSSDDSEIINMAKNYNILAPWKRPKNLSKDSTPSFKVVIHACNWYEKIYGKVDGVFVLQPTSPFRQINSVKKMIKLFKTRNKNPIISISRCVEHPEWMFELKKNKIKPFLSKKYLNFNSQNLKTLYRVNGLGYLLSPNTLRKEKTLIPKNAIGSIINSRIENIDIDNQEDLILAKKLISKK